jgi:hypothetical protein
VWSLRPWPSVQDAGLRIHAQRQGLAMLAQDHGVPWSCTTLRKLLGSLSAGMGGHRQPAPVDQVIHGLPQARASKGRLHPPLAVGRAGGNVPRRHGAWHEGATATVSVMDRRGTRVGPVSLGQRPEAGQPTLTRQWTAWLQDILPPGDAQGFRCVSGRDDGSHPRDYDHNGGKKMHAPKRPGRQRAWRRIVDSDQTCLDMQQRADAVCGPAPKGQAWATQRRTPLQTTSDGSTRV